MKLVTAILRLLGRPMPSDDVNPEVTARRAVLARLDRQDARLRALDAQIDAQLGRRR